MDITSLYTVIPHAEGLQALSHFLDQRPSQNPPSHAIIRLAELVLTLNAFQFNYSFYRQKCGVAMGTKMGPSFANLFVGYVEHYSLIPSHTRTLNSMVIILRHLWS